VVEEVPDSAKQSCLSTPHRPTTDVTLEKPTQGEPGRTTAERMHASGDRSFYPSYVCIGSPPLSKSLDLCSLFNIHLQDEGGQARRCLHSLPNVIFYVGISTPFLELSGMLEKGPAKNLFYLFTLAQSTAKFEVSTPHQKPPLGEQSVCHCPPQGHPGGTLIGPRAPAIPATLTTETSYAACTLRQESRRLKEPCHCGQTLRLPENKQRRGWKLQRRQVVMTFPPGSVPDWPMDRSPSPSKQPGVP
jgi:hypothetical protein